MTEHQRLLPTSATPLMLAASGALDPLPVLVDPYEGITLAYRNTPPRFMPFVVWQLGLGELTPYIPNLYDLVAAGVRWQRVRGTPRAISMGLGWLGYSSTLEEEPVRRRKWNRFQMEMDRVRDHDLPDLRRIAGVVSLSVPVRSHFYRGFRAYDVRAAELSHKRLSRSRLSSHSGVRIDATGPKWSFGRSHTGDHTMTQAELTALSAWVPEVPESNLWVDGTYQWSTSNFLWATPAARARRVSIAGSVSSKRAYLCLRDASGSVIGYRRAMLHPVRASAGGQYTVGSTQWLVDSSDPTAVLVTARTGFGDGSGRVATAMSVVLGCTLASGVPDGRLWLQPGDLSGGSEVASTSVSIELGLTVRELCQITLRF